MSSFHKGPTNFGWGKDLDFETELKKLIHIYQHCKKRKQRTYWAIYLTQLKQGCRISEALEAMLKWANTNETTLSVRARKRRPKDPYMRRVNIAKEVIQDKVVKQYLKSLDLYHVDKKDNVIVDDRYQLVVMRLIHFIKYQLKYNSHALRYAFISFMSNEGHTPQLIARMTGQKTLDMILHYTERNKADKALDKVAML